MDHDDGISNPSGNRPFHAVLAANLSRRKILAGGLATAASAFLAGPGAAVAASGGTPARDGARRPLIGFRPVPVGAGSGPMPRISEDYEFQVLIPWGEPIQPGSGIAWRGEPNTRPSPDEQAQQVGIGHDGMCFFADNGKSNERGVLAINHEFGDNLHVLGKPAPASLDDVRLSQHAHGVSVVEIRKLAGVWQTVDSPKARRIHGNTPMAFSGPAAGHALLQTPAGSEPAGTLNNCANGNTPWGTYLTCEENFNGYFGATGPWTPTEAQARYGLTAAGFGYGWHHFDARFDLSDPDYRNEENRFGWVVEVDPADPAQAPTKRTALGRFKHEGVALTVGRGGRVVAYMGDDEAFDYVYKFVSERNWKSTRAQGLSPLDHGSLYVARFNDDGSGDWLELTIDDPALAARFADQAEVLTYVRLAADLLGATPMDRPEWATVAPGGEVYLTLTNNSSRTVATAANPQAPNSDGHIIRWRDSEQHTGTTFRWEVFLLASDTHGTEQSCSDPDGLWADPDGRLFIQTDGGQKDGLNNQMLVVDPSTGELRRLFTGVTADEITGIAVTPDRRTMFVNIRHPGNGNPALTNFPSLPDGVTIPRDATCVITRKDGGVIGS